MFQTKESLVKDLIELGINTRSILLVHSSLKSLGYVEGGAPTVIDALSEVVGKEGTVVVPTFTWCFVPEKANPDFSRQGPFDLRKTPSTTGLITETLRCQKEAQRSFHPIHSVTAIGAQAEDIAKDHPKTTDFGPGSPFDRIVRGGGYILLAGVGHHVNSTIHYVEDQLDLPFLEEKKAQVIDGTGNLQTVVLRKCPVGHRDFYKKEGSKLEQALQNSNIIHLGRVGEATVQLMKASELVEIAKKIIAKEPDILLCDNPKCNFCSTGKLKLKKWTPREKFLN